MNMLYQRLAYILGALLVVLLMVWLFGQAAGKPTWSQPAPVPVTAVPLTNVPSSTGAALNRDKSPIDATRPGVSVVMESDSHLPSGAGHQQSPITAGTFNGKVGEQLIALTWDSNVDPQDPTRLQVHLQVTPKDPRAMVLDVYVLGGITHLSGLKSDIPAGKVGNHLHVDGTVAQPDLSLPGKLVVRVAYAPAEGKIESQLIPIDVAARTPAGAIMRTPDGKQPVTMDTRKAEEDAAHGVRHITDSQGKELILMPATPSP